MSQSSKLLTDISKASRAVDEVFRKLEEEAAVTNKSRTQEINRRKAALVARRAKAEAKLAADRKQIQADNERFEQEKARMARILAVQKEKVTLDVGGNRFSTAMATLKSIEGSRFDDFFNGELEPDEEDGSYFIDRDGRHFHLLLEFLRNPDTFELPTNASTLRELEKEAAFYRVELPKKAAPAAPPPAQTRAQPAPAAAAQPAADNSNATRAASLSVADENKSHPEAYQAADPAKSKPSHDDGYHRESWYGGETATPLGGPAGGPQFPPVPEGAAVAAADNSVFGPTPPVGKYSAGPPPLPTQPTAVPQPYFSQPPPQPSTASALFGNSAAPPTQPAESPRAEPSPASAPSTAPPPLNSGGYHVVGGYPATSQPAVQPAVSMFQPAPPPTSSQPHPAMAPPPLMSSGNMYGGHTAPPMMPGPPPMAQPTQPPTTGPPTSSYSSNEWGSAQLSGMPLDPVSQPQRNKLRGWNDPPKMKSARPRAMVPPPAPVTAFNPAPYVPGPPASAAPVSAHNAPPMAPNHTAPPPAAAAPPPPAPKRNFVLPDYAQGMAQSLRVVIERCRERPAVAKKAKTIEDKLDDLYEGIVNGSIDAGTVAQLAQLAANVEHGNHAAAQQEHKRLILDHGMDDVSKRIMILKNLIAADAKK